MPRKQHLIPLVAGLNMLAGIVGANPLRPITNPVNFDSPEVSRLVHPIFIYQALPDKVSTTLGNLPVGGDFQVYAVQLEIPFNENLSLVALKDGYIDYNPDDTLSTEDGWADLAAGLKYVCYRSEDNDVLVSIKGVMELPTGNDNVWQGNGDGTLNPSVSGLLKVGDKTQLAGTLGHIFALSGEESSVLFDSWHFSYALTEKFFPVLELNHHWVTDAGDGVTQFNDHVDGGVPAVANFEGGDLVNFGAVNADDEHQLNIGIGARYRAHEGLDLGAAVELPLHDDKEGLIDYRVTVDAVYYF